MPPPPEPHMTDRDVRLRALAAARWRVAIALTAAMVAIYFGFIALIAFRRELLATLVMPGLTLGILLGALVIVASWLLTWIYVRWANGVYDAGLAELKGPGTGGRVSGEVDPTRTLTRTLLGHRHRHRHGH